MYVLRWAKNIPEESWWAKRREGQLFQRVNDSTNVYPLYATLQTAQKAKSSVWSGEYLEIEEVVLTNPSE